MNPDPKQCFRVHIPITQSHINTDVFLKHFAGASHQEAAERVHAVHEGDAAGGAGRVHAQGVRCHQPDPRPQGENQSKTTF
jgi:hypothetical protein